MALGVAVMIAVIVIYSVAVRQFEQSAQGYHLIVGGKGGALQLVLSTVYHIGQPLYPIPYSYYEKFLPGGEFASVTATAIPQCLGDSYQSPDNSVFRVVATTPGRNRSSRATVNRAWPCEEVSSMRSPSFNPSLASSSPCR